MALGDVSRIHWFKDTCCRGRRAVEIWGGIGVITIRAAIFRLWSKAFQNIRNEGAGEVAGETLDGGWAFVEEAG